MKERLELIEDAFLALYRTIYPELPKKIQRMLDEKVTPILQELKTLKEK